MMSHILNLGVGHSGIKDQLNTGVHFSSFLSCAAELEKKAHKRSPLVAAGRSAVDWSKRAVTKHPLSALPAHVRNRGAFIELSVPTRSLLLVCCYSVPIGHHERGQRGEQQQIGDFHRSNTRLFVLQSKSSFPCFFSPGAFESFGALNRVNRVWQLRASSASHIPTHSTSNTIPDQMQEQLLYSPSILTDM